MTTTNHSDALRAELDSTRRRLCTHGVPFANCSDHRSETTPEDTEKPPSETNNPVAGEIPTDDGPDAQNGAQQ